MLKYQLIILCSLIYSYSCSAQYSIDSLKNTLDTIFITDQEHRQNIVNIEKKSGSQSSQLREAIQKMQQSDSINLYKVSQILEKIGFPSKSKIGPKRTRTIFLVIQHADLKTQIKFYPLLKRATINGDLEPIYLAYMEDRIAVGLGKKQIYGTQLELDSITGSYRLAPLKDPKFVDRRRLKVGMEKIESYLKNWNIVWDVEEYINQQNIERPENNVPKDN